MENTNSDFREFPKMARLSRQMIITEKIDGTNAQILITEAGDFFIGSRTRWITPEQDNHGFARWALEHKDELMQLGAGRHFGEWWGSGIQRGYGLPKGEKRFSLFNTVRWCLHNEPKNLISSVNGVDRYQDQLPECCGLVPVLYKGEFDSDWVDICLRNLQMYGSYAQKGFMNPEGVVVFHTAANMCFKKTIDNDDTPKSLAK